MMKYGMKMNLVSEFGDDNDDDSDMVVKFLSGREQSDSTDDKYNISGDSDMQHGTWSKVGAQ
jgi:hypothetical protein